MKKPISLIEGLFLLFLYFKLTGTGLALSWFWVFSPFLFSAVFTVLEFFVDRYGVVDRIKFWLWKIDLKIKSSQEIKKEKRHIRQMDQVARFTKAGGNPGAFQDPVKTGEKKL